MKHPCDALVVVQRSNFDTVEVTPEMIDAGVAEYYRHALSGWENPGLSDLKLVLQEVYREMASVAAM